MRRHTLALVSLVLASAMISGGFNAVRAQGCEYPLFIQQGAVDANIVFLFDSSGSMNTAVYHTAYDPFASYAGPFSGSDMNVSADGIYYPYDFDNTLTDTIPAPLVTSDMGNSARYETNYLNWVYYHADDTQRANLPQATRMIVAKPSVNNVILANPNIRFGVFKFNGTDGATRIADLGTAHATIVSQINTISGGGYTPIGESMVDIWQYLGDSGLKPIEYSCQLTFLVVVTDGLPTQDDNRELVGDADGDGEWIDDLAKYFVNNDAAPYVSGDDNHVNTYTVGFSVDANVLQDAADMGGGLYINANTPQQLSSALQKILRDIAAKISAGSSVAVVSTEGSTQNLLFRAKFLPSRWQGFLEAFELPYVDNEPPLWEAGDLLSQRTAASRTIYTTLGGSKIVLTNTYANSMVAALGVLDDIEAGEVIDWTLGEDLPGYRDRQGWKLGDIVESSPIVVGAPVGFYLYDDYLTFRAANETRLRVLYVGANDGMIHCFRESDGLELWAWIPEAVHPRLADLADFDYCHQFTMNLTPKVFDAYVGGQWRTILIAGQKEGGDAYLALDITDPGSPEYLWETQLPGMNGSWATPEIARVQSLGTTVAFVGTGPDTTNGQAWLKGIDLEDGSLVYDQMLSDNAGTTMNKTTSARAIDTDYDGWHDLIYAADMEGSLWRVDLSSGTFDVTELYAGSYQQPVTAAPILTIDYNDDVMLYFGTGRYLENTDFANVDPQSFYNVIDNHSGVTVTRMDLIDETTTITPVSATDRGWYIDLENQAGERCISQAALVAGFVYFTTFVPTFDACAAGGFSWLYAANFRNASGDDGDDDETNDTITDRLEVIGAGVATRPVIDVANEEVIIQGSDTRIHISDARGIIRHLVVRSWRQRYD
jgi:type IV pilus assembly protein PilY1